MRNRGRTKLIVHTHTCMDIVRISIFKSRKWCRHRSEQRSAHMIVNPFVIVRTAATAISIFGIVFRNINQEKEDSWEVVAVCRYSFDHGLSKGTDRIRIQSESKSKMFCVRDRASGFPLGVVANIVHELYVVTRQHPQALSERRLPSKIAVLNNDNISR